MKGNLAIQSMLEAATSALSEMPTGEFTQAIAVHTDSDHIYVQTIANALSEDKSDETHLFQMLENKGDTKIITIVCVWQSGCIDLPSYAWRQMLCDLNEENKNAAILLQSDGEYTLKKLAVTLYGPAH